MPYTPRQSIVDFLSTPIAFSADALTLAGDEATQRGIHSTSGGLGAIPSTITFLKEREVPHFYACIVTFTDSKGQNWEMVCLAQQDEQENWMLRNGSGSAPHASKKAQKSDTAPTRVELVGGPGTEGGFYAGGYITGSDVNRVKRVLLIAQDGKTLEDIVNEKDDGRVLFVTEQTMQAPVRAVVGV